MLPFERRSNKLAQPGRLARPVLPLLLVLVISGRLRRCSRVARMGRPLPRVLVPDARRGADSGGRVEGDGDGDGSVVVEQLHRRAAPSWRLCAEAPDGSPTRPARPGNSRRPRGTSWWARRFGGRGMRMGERMKARADVAWLARARSRIQLRSGATTWKVARPGFGNTRCPVSADQPRRRSAPPTSAAASTPPPPARASEAQPCAETGSDANGYAAAIYLYAADLVLEQQAGPSVGGVGGELASAATVGGASPISFTASDPLSGDLRGRVLGGRPGGAEHRSRRRRRPLPEPGADQRRPAGLPRPAALPPGRERPGRPRHHQDRQRHPPARGQRARRRWQLGARARTPGHGPQRGPRAARTGPTPPPRPPSR